MWPQHYDIQTDIQTDRQTDRQTYIHTDRQTEPKYDIDKGKNEENSNFFLEEDLKTSRFEKNVKGGVWSKCRSPVREREREGGGGPAC